MTVKKVCTWFILGDLSRLNWGLFGTKKNSSGECLTRYTKYLFIEKKLYLLNLE